MKILKSKHIFRFHRRSSNERQMIIFSDVCWTGAHTMQLTMRSCRFSLSLPPMGHSSRHPAIGECERVNNTNAHKSFGDAKWELNGHHKILCAYFWNSKEKLVLLVDCGALAAGSAISFFVFCIHSNGRDGGDFIKRKKQWISDVQKIIRIVHSERQGFSVRIQFTSTRLGESDVQRSHASGTMR